MGCTIDALGKDATAGTFTTSCTIKDGSDAAITDLTFRPNAVTGYIFPGELDGM